MVMLRLGSAWVLLEDLGLLLVLDVGDGRHLRPVLDSLRWNPWRGGGALSKRAWHALEGLTRQLNTLPK